MLAERGQNCIRDDLPACIYVIWRCSSTDVIPPYPLEYHLIPRSSTACRRERSNGHNHSQPYKTQPLWNGPLKL
jgi:hypothetical protein